MKTEFYPRTDKEKLFALGYLAKPSAHARGSTERSILAPATTVWTCWQTHQTFVQAAQHYATVKH
jgi:hypothetical protein